MKCTPNDILEFIPEKTESENGGYNND
jgi:DNA-binding Xre family transcriptional regulator